MLCQERRDTGVRPRDGREGVARGQVHEVNMEAVADVRRIRAMRRDRGRPVVCCPFCHLCGGGEPVTVVGIRQQRLHPHTQ